jgi:hypothetical protein
MPPLIVGILKHGRCQDTRDRSNALARRTLAMMCSIRFSGSMSAAAIAKNAADVA